jgi:two-component system, NtrC family, sensor kinase
MTKILVVDDEESIRTMMRMTLELDGYEVFTAGDGETALGLFGDKAPDVVLLDVRMPGMGGIEVLRRMRSLSPEAEVIIITGHGDMNMAVDCLRQEASNFLVKPVGDELLSIALKRSLEKLALKRKLKEYTRNLETLLREGNAELEKSFRFRENLIENSPDAIVSVGRNGEIAIFNSAAEKLLGYREEDVVGKFNIVNLYKPGVAKALMKDLRSPEYGGRGALRKREVIILHKDGREIPVFLSAAILYEHGREAGSVGIFTDLRERKELERKLLDREVRPPRAVEVQASLDRIRAGVETLRRSLSGNDAASGALDAIIMETEQIRAIIQSVSE